MNRVCQGGLRSTPTLLDGASSLLQISGRDPLDEDVAVREPGAGNLMAKRDGNQLVCGRQRQICRKEAEAAGNEILVRGYRGGVGCVVPVRESDQGRRVNERHLAQDFTVR